MAFKNVPVNGWPQIKDLEKLDAIASQIENMPTFTSEDRAFLEDLPSYPDTDGTKMLTATTTSGNTSLSYEDIPEELPADPQSDGTRVLTATTNDGETVKSWETASQGMPDFSTTEHKTGQKWIDGKDIYERTYILKKNNVDQYTFTNNLYDIGLTGVDFAIVKSFFSDRARESYIDSLPISNELYLSFKKDTGAVYIINTHSPANIYVTLQYTKSASNANKLKGGK